MKVSAGKQKIKNVSEKCKMSFIRMRSDFKQIKEIQVIDVLFRSMIIFWFRYQLVMRISCFAEQTTFNSPSRLLLPTWAISQQSHDHQHQLKIWSTVYHVP